LVPFYAFGNGIDSPWYRLSVGTCKVEEIPVFLGKLEAAIRKLQ
jgi:aspartate aminotransferase